MGEMDYLYEPTGAQLHWDGLKKDQQPQRTSVPAASLSGRGMMGSQEQPMATHAMGPSTPEMKQVRQPQAPQTRPPTDDELMSKALSMMEDQGAQHRAQLANPALSPRNDAGGQMPSWLTEYMKHEGQ